MGQNSLSTTEPGARSNQAAVYFWSVFLLFFDNHDMWSRIHLTVRSYCLGRSFGIFNDYSADTVHHILTGFRF